MRKLKLLAVLAIFFAAGCAPDEKLMDVTIISVKDSDSIVFCGSQGYTIIEINDTKQRFKYCGILGEVGDVFAKKYSLKGE